MSPPTTLGEHIARLKQADIVPLPRSEEWREHVERLSVSGRVSEVTDEHYFYWLEVLPPKWMSGSHFCFAEGAEALRLFWQDRDGRSFGRQLTWDETIVFCRLARIPLPD